MTLLAALLPGLAGAQAITVPSDLMRPEPAQAARGYVVSWVFTIDLESDELKGMERCRSILMDAGFLPVLSKSASSAAPELHFKISGSKNYPLADTGADQVLEAVRQAKCPGALRWTVATKPVGMVR